MCSPVIGGTKLRSIENRSWNQRSDTIRFGPRHNFPPAGLIIVKEVEEVLTQALAYTRTLVAELAPPVLHEFGLLAALPWLAEQMKRYGLAVTVELPQKEDLRLPTDRLVLIFQSVKELLLNAAKHAHTGRASVLLERRGEDLRIEVRDAGEGFDPAALTAALQSASTPGFGLFSIRERMLALGGRLELISSPGHGTSATLIMPLTCMPKQDGTTALPASTPLAADQASRPSVGQSHVRPSMACPHPAPRFVCCWPMIMPWCVKASEARYKTTLTFRWSAGRQRARGDSDDQRNPA